MAAEVSSTRVGKGANKHCCWGICKHDSRYPVRLPPGTIFISFPKVGKLKDSQIEWQKKWVQSNEGKLQFKEDQN